MPTVAAEVPGPQVAYGFVLYGGLPVLDSGCPRATQPPCRWQHGRHAPATREADEPPRAAHLPGAAELMCAPGRSSMGVKLPGPLRDYGLGNHRVHDILLACGTTLFGRCIDIVFQGYDGLAEPNSPVASLMGDPNAHWEWLARRDDWPAAISAWLGRNGQAGCVAASRFEPVARSSPKAIANRRLRWR
jgi:hypothetical protein